MTRDERIIEYLRARGRDRPPDGFVSSVMAALDDPMPSRSRFAAWVPAVAIAAGAAVVAAVTLLIGQGPDVGPGPSPATSSPTPNASVEPTIDDLGVALLDAVDVLRAAPGVEGRQQVEIAGIIGSATWFDWRPNGDQVVVQRQDLDVTETGWWMVPDGAPPATGQRIYTFIQAKVGDQSFFTNEAGDWQVAGRDDGFRMGAFGPAILDGSIPPWRPLDGLVASLEDPAEARVQRDELPDGGTEWELGFEWMGAPLSQRWTIGPGGELRSWTLEREDRSVDPEGRFYDNATHAWLEYTITDGDPIKPPDADTEPDAADVGLPADFPLPVPAPNATESSTSLEQLRAAVTDALDALRSHAGVEGIGTNYVFDEVGEVSWFSWRANGDQVVVNRSDLDVTESGWWLGPDAEPPARGTRIQTAIQVITGGGYYFTREEVSGDDEWISGLQAGSPDVLGIPFPAALDGRVDPWQGAFVLTLEGEASVRRLGDGGEEWIVRRAVREGFLVQVFGIGPDGVLRSISHELIGVEPTIDERPVTSAFVELTVLEDPEPIPPPDTDSPPDPAVFGMPDLPLPPDPSDASRGAPDQLRSGIIAHG